MRFELDKHEKYVLLKPLDIDTLNSESSPKLKSEIILIHTEDIYNIILDLSNVRQVDESGISALLSANRLCRNYQGTFVLACVHSDIKSLLELSTTENYINIVPTVTEAIDLIFMEEIERDLRKEMDDDLPE
jgi:anti-sigma B factor antagonist